MKYNKILLTAILFVFSALTFLHAQSEEELQQLIKNERYDQAKVKALAWIAKKPKETKAYYYYGLALYNEAEADTNQVLLDSAKLEFNNGIKADDDFSLNYIGLGLVAALEGDYSVASHNYDLAYQKDEKDLPTLINLGKAYANLPLVKDPNGKSFGEKGIDVLTKAEQLLDKKKKKEEKIPVYIALGSIYKAQNDGSKAVSYFQRATDLNPKLQEAYIARAEIYANVNKSEAENYYKKAIEVDPTNPSAYRSLSNLYYNYKDYDNSIKYWQMYIQNSGTSSYKEQRLASIYYVKNDFNKATDILNKSLDSDPNNPVTLRLLSNIYLSDSTTYNKAVSTFEQYLKVSPKITVGDYKKYADALSKCGRDNDALESYQKAYNLDTSKIEILTNIADVAFKIRDWKRVESNLSMKQQKVPADFTVMEYLNLGRAYFFDSNYVKAEEVFKQITVKYPTFVYGWFWGARSAASQDPDGSKFLALPYYQKLEEIITKEPTNIPAVTKNKKELAEAYVYLGFWNLSNSKNDEAKVYFDKTLILDPENAQAKEGLKNLEPQKKEPVKKNGKKK